MYLAGRRVDALESVVRACKQKGADAVAKAIDVVDRDAMKQWLQEVDSQNQVRIGAAIRVHWRNISPD